MHREAFSYVQQAVASIDLSDLDVIEFGSYIVNGTVRPLFVAARAYTGVDVRPGDGVDVVADAATYKRKERADLVVTTEMLEHAPRPKQVIANIARLLKPGGVLILTAAGVERQPHGNDGNAVGDEFYRNVSEEDLSGWLDAAGFASYRIERNQRAGDIYCTAVR